jgi:hypothetical protein
VIIPNVEENIFIQPDDHIHVNICSSDHFVQ